MPPTLVCRSGQTFQTRTDDRFPPSQSLRPPSQVLAADSLTRRWRVGGSPRHRRVPFCPYRLDPLLKDRDKRRLLRPQTVLQIRVRFQRKRQPPSRSPRTLAVPNHEPSSLRGNTTESIPSRSLKARDRIVPARLPDALHAERAPRVPPCSNFLVFHTGLLGRIRTKPQRNRWRTPHPWLQ